MVRLLLILLLLISNQVIAVDGYFEDSYGLYLKCEKTLDGEGDSSVATPASFPYLLLQFVGTLARYMTV